MNLREFTDPPKKYRPIPCWSLNNELEPAELETQIRDFKKKGFGGFVLRAGDGLKTPYLSEEWSKALRRAIDVANELKIEAWLHDEDRGHSGYAGGMLTADADANLPLVLIWSPSAETVDTELLSSALAFTRTDSVGNHSLLPSRPESLNGVGVFFLKTIERGEALYNGEAPGDMLNPNAISDFIAKTHEFYSKTFKYDFGEYLPGIMTGGAVASSACTVALADGSRCFPWSPWLPEHFEKLTGYSILDGLHHLLSGAPEGFRFRHDFRRAVNDLFIETFTFAVSKWCSDHDMMLAGTVAGAAGVRPADLNSGIVMPHYEHLGMPVVESPGYTMQDKAAVLAAVSAAAQFNKQRVMAKVFGSSGHDRSFGELKAIVDCHAALGINAFSPQQVLYSTMGERKYDNPPTLSYHHPAWDHIKALTDYTARCAWIAGQGRHTASVLVMQPSSGAYGLFDQNIPGGGVNFEALERSFNTVVDELIAEHIACHIGDERITGRYGTIEGSQLRIGYGDYDTIILPPAPSWRGPVVDLLEKFTGSLIIMGEIPALVDGVPSERISALSSRNNVIVIPDEPSKAGARVVEKLGRRISVTGPDGSEARHVLANHRIDAGAHILFLANTDAESGIAVNVTVQALGGVVELDPATGRAYRYHAVSKDGAIHIETTLAPFGSRIFIIDQTQTSVEAAPIVERETPMSIEGPYLFRAANDNCLVLDRCDLAMDNRSLLTNASLAAVKRTVWEKTGLDEYRGVQPWVLKSKNIRSRTNKTVLTYRFTITDKPETIALGMEHSDRFTVTINGAAIDFSPGRWFIDRRYRVLNLEDHVKEGENIIIATTDYLWDTELSPVYVFGDFAVGGEHEGFPIIKKPAELPGGAWTEHGFPFYAGTMTYTLSFALTREEGARYELDLSGMKGAVAAVKVNETEVGLIPYPPYRGDITGALTDGANTVEVSVAGTLRNVFGPLHDTGESSEYRFSPCGLLKPPRIIKITAGN